MVKLTPLVKRAIQQKLPWAPRFGISREAYARLTGTPVPETVPRQSSLVKLRSRLIQVPHEPDNPHIFYEATLNNGQRVSMCGKLVHPLAAILFLGSLISKEVMHAWGAAQATPQAPENLLVPKRYRGRDSASYAAGLMEERQVNFWRPLWETTCGQPRCINPLHIRDETVFLSFLHLDIPDVYVGFWTPDQLGPLRAGLKPPKYGKSKRETPTFSRVPQRPGQLIPTLEFQHLLSAQGSAARSLEEENQTRREYGYEELGEDGLTDTERWMKTNTERKEQGLPSLPDPNEHVPNQRRRTELGFSIDLNYAEWVNANIANQALEALPEGYSFHKEPRARTVTIVSNDHDEAIWRKTMGDLAFRGLRP